MYRKYSNSTKCSRNERLAQLTEQESVIERKKKEIQAKLEARKKRETEEALKKIDTSNTNVDLSKRHDLNRKGKSSDHEEINAAPCPRNAFTNDGSFLDQFKKLSKSGLGTKNADFSTFSTSRENKAVQEESRDHICMQNYNRRNEEYDCRTSADMNPIPSVPVNIDPNYTGSDAHSRVIPTTKITKPAQNFPYHYPQSENSYRGDGEKVSSPVTSTSTTHISSIEPPLPIMPQNVPRLAPIEDRNNPPQSLLSSESDGLQMQDDGNHSLGREDLFVRITGHTVPGERERGEVNRTDPDPSSSSSSKEGLRVLPRRERNFSLNTVDAPRISPALTFDEEDSCCVIDGSHRGRASDSNKGDARQQQSRSGPEHSSSSASYEDNGNNRDGSGHPGTRRNSASSAQDPSQCLSGAQRVHSESDSDREGSHDGDKRKRKTTTNYDSSDSDTNSRDSFQSRGNASQEDFHLTKDGNKMFGDGYQADCEDESRGNSRKQKKVYSKTSAEDPTAADPFRSKLDCNEQRDDENGDGANSSASERRKRKKKSRWGDEVVSANASSAGAPNAGVHLPAKVAALSSAVASGGKTPMLSKLTRSDPGLIQYARQTFGSTNLSEEDWKKAEDHYKINLLYQDMVKKRAEIENLEKAGKFKYEYDSDEDVEGGTWEHKLRQQEMMATQLWADELTRQAAGKHHIGDFLPPEELERFMEKYNAVKEGRKPDLSDYKEFKLKEDNVGYRLLQKMGWNEGQGLGQDGSGITHPVNKASTRHENQGLGVNRPDGLEAGDDEYDAYRKRMMLAYRFRPNPLNNPRRPYY